MRAGFPVSLKARLELSLYEVEVGRYSSLCLEDTARPHWIISFVQSGQVETSTRGVHGQVAHGDAMIHPPNLPFTERAVGPGTHLYFAFEMQTPPNLDLLRLYPVAPVVRLLSPDLYAQTFGQLQAVWAAPVSPVRDLRVFTLATELLAQILQSWDAQGSPPRPCALQTAEDRFTDVVNYMASHLDRKLTRDDLARRVFLHPGYLDRVFRAAYGVAPMQMLRDLRLRRAKKLLESTDDTLDSIAHVCGLGDAAAFSRAFRARYGAAPGRYRQTMRLTR
jgi:AraC-like DNA-binding protein